MFFPATAFHFPLLLLWCHEIWGQILQEMLSALHILHPPAFTHPTKHPDDVSAFSLAINSYVL